VATRDKATFVLQLLVPLGGLPLLGWPAVLLVVPPLAYLLLANYKFMSSISFHYNRAAHSLSLPGDGRRSAKAQWMGRPMAPGGRGRAVCSGSSGRVAVEPAAGWALL